MEKLTKLQRKHTNFPIEDLPAKEEDGTKKYYAWFSKTQKMHKLSFPLSTFGSHKRQPLSNIYLNENNEKIEVTHISQSANPNIYFDDIEYRGIVVKWIRCIYE